MLNPRVVITNLLLLIAAGLTWWLADSLVPKESPVPKTEDEEQIDYFAKNIHRTNLNEEGKPSEVLFAERMTHYKDDNRTVMEKPVLTINNSESSNPWIIKSEKGTSLAGGEAVLLQGKVVITHANDKGEELKIYTSNVKYVPDKNFAETAEKILMVSPGDATSAVGAEVYFKPDLIVNLLSDVRRKHEFQ